MSGEARVVEVLAAHGGWKCDRVGDGWRCWCGASLRDYWPAGGVTPRDTALSVAHRAHVADALATAGVGVLEAALTDAADAVRDAREYGLPTGATGHPTHPYIEKWLRDRADWIGGCVL